LFCLLLTAGATIAAGSESTTHPDGNALLHTAVNKWIDLIEPPHDQAPRTFTARVRLVKSEGLEAEFAGATGEIAVQAPDRLRATATVAGQDYAVGRDGQQLWVHEPAKKFAVIGKPGVARFKSDPASIDHTILPPFEMPISRLKVRLAMVMVNAEVTSREKIGDDDCYALRLTLLPSATELLGIKVAPALLWLRVSDLMPLRASYADGRQLNVQVDILDPKLSEPWPADKWKLVPNEGDKVETVALSHLTQFMEIAPRIAQEKVPSLGKATGKRELLGTSGEGRLELIDGTRVLFLKGSPEEMGRQHGKLLKAQIHDVAEKILYGVGVGSSFAKGEWFFGQIEAAQARLLPFMDERYLREEDAIAKAAGMHRQEARLANFFPELFHCSGFALTGAATKDGHIYHGRVLDYLRGVGLEENAVLIIHQPDDGRYAWANVSYAGFVGSVTAMNEKGISIGEMGGRGEGQWNGKPMAHLVREVMEKAATLDEAVAIMRNSPRTCEYYYVIADGHAKTAVGIAATPETFEMVKPGEAHRRLPHPVPDTVLLSAGDRYETLVGRVKAGYGAFDDVAARDLMARPVCMESNIQSVLFRPDTLDMWVANADSKHVASAARYTHYNLRELLKRKPAEAGF
jgi:hypothetical protein